MKAISSTRRESEWRERLSRHATSRLSVKAFCERESVSQWAFYQWRSRLRRRDSEVVMAVRAAPVKFIEVSTPRPRDEAHESVPRVRNGERFEIKLELGEGVVLHLARF